MTSSSHGVGPTGPEGLQLLDAMPDAVVLVDQHGVIVAINAQAEALFGWPRADLVGRSLEALVPESLREMHSKHREAFAAAARVRPMGSGASLRAVRRDGSQLDVEVSLAPLSSAGGRYVVAAVRDASERVRLAAAQKRLQDELREAQKMEGIGRLAGGIAHDFNNLLAVVLGISSMLLEDLPQGDPVRADLEQIDQAARRARSLTQQLLAFSRRQILEPSIVALDHLVRDMDEMLRRLIGEQVDLRAVLARDTGRVRVDAGQLQQVILNLVLNARDAMPAGGRLTLETRNVELDEGYARGVEVAPGRYVMLAVSDSGGGMDAETASRVFEPFFTTKAPGKGTGLGLSTVHGVVKQSGGHVAVYSEPGRGTVFKVYLPRVDDPLTLPLPAAPVSDRPGRGETILLVEDEELVRASLRRMLVRAGYVVLDTGDPLDALRLAASSPTPVRLLLTDVVMPKTDGHTLAEQLVKLKPDLRVLYMSGYTDNAIVHHGVLAPGIAFIQKPASADALARRVREVLDAPAGAWRH